MKVLFTQSRLAWIAAVLLCLGLLNACGGEPGQQNDQQPPVPVTITSVEAESIEHFGHFAGRLRGAREVDVRAQVSGILIERRFVEGDAVEQGQALFQIDPEPYQIQVDSAGADLVDATAANQQAQSEWRRIKALYEQDATSRREYEQAESHSKAAIARVTQAESALADAERNLRYTRVEAPITGMSGIESLSEGNLVDTGTMLTRVTQIDPIDAHFSLPEAAAVVRRWRMHQAPEMDTYQKAWLIMPDGREYEQSGEINFVANRVNEESASVVMRAEFTNPDNLLIPGQLIRVRVLLGHYDEAFLIDPTAVSQGTDGPFVYVVNNDKAEQRQVELGPEIDGKQVITDGLVEGEKLVINGLVALSDGATVDPISADEQE